LSSLVNMSRIGSQPIAIPENTTVTLSDNIVTVKGPLGELTKDLPKRIKVEIKDKIITFTRPNDNPKVKALHGLTRALVNNLIEGVNKGFEKKLEMVGTGYRVTKNGEGLTLTVGYSHPVEVEPTPGVTLEVEGNNKITIKGIDKHLVGQTAANIRAIKTPEPYKGKGIRYEGEVVRRKAGKAAKAVAV
jgi:large subunit ribosomal protein L6